MDHILKKPDQSIVLFSGGSDSTLAAALMAKKNQRVHLLTYNRFSFLGAKDYTAKNYERLCKIFGKDHFQRKILPMGIWHKKIGYHNYFPLLKRFGLFLGSLSFSKLAMHYYTLKYALENNITLVADGMVPYMDLYPDQNEKIALGAVRKLYQDFGIEYINPVFPYASEVEPMLYDLGITEKKWVRGTEEDKQVYYAEQVLLALFLKYALTRFGKKNMNQLWTNFI